MMQIITREIAEKVRNVVDAGLSSGLGTQALGQMCVEAAVCYALGLPHGDDPGCVSQALRSLKIRLNDSQWSSNVARAKGLRRLAVAQLGSKGVLDDQEFARRVVDLTIRRVVPMALRSAASVNPKQSGNLEASAVRCEQEGTRDAVIAARGAAYTADTGAAYAASATTAYAADTADTSAAAEAAATAAAYAADATAATADALCDARLGQFAEWVVEILIDMKAPGCQWLGLVPVE